MFQSTPPRGGRRRGGRSGGGSWGFNPRPRAGGDSPGTPASRRSLKFQSTPPRGGRPRGRAPRPHHRHEVSIHAPARGATQRWIPVSSQPEVSIHAPARGATECSVQLIGEPIVSIHAPARGATNGSRMEPPGGLFQSTPPRGGRPAAAPRSHRPGPRFNPRPRAGGDTNSPHRSVMEHQFQSTPPRGGRPAQVREELPLDRVSIHAPARGATRRGDRSPWR